MNDHMGCPVPPPPGPHDPAPAPMCQGQMECEQYDHRGCRMSGVCADTPDQCPPSPYDSMGCVPQPAVTCDQPGQIMCSYGKDSRVSEWAERISAE